MSALPFNLSELQWALLIFGLIVVLVIIMFSLRDKGGGVKPDARGSRVISQPRVEEPSTYGIGGEFDEFGVGRPRRRGEAPPAKVPQLNIDPGPIHRAPPPERKLPSYMNQPAATSAPVAPARRMAPTIAPVAPPIERAQIPPAAPVERPAPPPAPAVERTAPSSTSAAPAAVMTPAAPRKVEEKIVTLVVGRTGGAPMAGPKIHAALGACGLSFGPMQIYHRKQEGKRVFSVASLMKPGFLNPEDADGFGTMALSIFMVLPGPVEGTAAFDDMLQTAQKLADALEAQLFDDRKQPLSMQAAQKLRDGIKTWAASAGTAT
jgi:cell division protein ZipA